MVKKFEDFLNGKIKDQKIDWMPHELDVKWADNTSPGKGEITRHLP